MDIVKPLTAKSLLRRNVVISAGLGILVLVIFLAGRYRNVTYLVYEESLLVDEVVAGDLDVSIRGYGQLVAQDVYWIGAETRGRIARILAKPGDYVHAGDELVQMVNLQLLQELKDAELELAARRAEIRATQVARESQILNLRSEASSAEIDHQTAKMDLDAKAELMSKGLEIISRLDFDRTQLTVQKFKQRFEMQELRIAKSEESMLATHQAEQARLSQTENELQKIRDQVAGLSILANVEGIVQDMELELGQQIESGNNITRIARPDQLVAEVKIQELQVNDIQPGLSATVDTRTSEIEAVVSRIDPAVIDGSVLVELELIGNLPSEVRPDLNIEANISVAHVANTLYVRRPVFARPYSESYIYKISADGDIAERIAVRYGQASTNFIEVLEGIEVGDRVIVSDATSFSTHDRILIR